MAGNRQAVVENKQEMAEYKQAAVDNKQLGVADNSDLLVVGNTGGGDAHDVPNRYHVLYSHHNQRNTMMKTTS
jgi:hypothetical protein